ncbi:hypothetical protein M758_10G023000 [Ceratodon purpureus]|uniref:Uncharacterized protein n=1 Tax=Ceratodon purpureus TaxID=3225 RepID=A0A8T0GMY2_CERPU|nr:hypothetical protein KC19_10G024700 [Ceratodon purpureus]KAG0602559.1 hypothetical protein M758_10G023000 [Ceratodon purpureus]
MAKLLLLIATLLVAATVVAEAHSAAPAPAPAPVTSPHLGTKSGLLSMKLILHNVAKRPVTFKLVNPVVSKPVVALKGKWNAIEPALFSAKHTNLLVSVTVENNKHVMVNKTLKINLLQHFKTSELKGKKFLVLTAVESWSWKSKYLLITMGELVVLTIKL